MNYSACMETNSNQEPTNDHGITITVTPYRTGPDRLAYAYTNSFGAQVATRTQDAQGNWTVRLYTDPLEHEDYYGVSDERAERLCLDHAEAFS